MKKDQEAGVLKNRGEAESDFHQACDTFNPKAKGFMENELWTDKTYRLTRSNWIFHPQRNWLILPFQLEGTLGDLFLVSRSMQILLIAIFCCEILWGTTRRLKFTAACILHAAAFILVCTDRKVHASCLRRCKVHIQQVVLRYACSNCGLFEQKFTIIWQLIIWLRGCMLHKRFPWRGTYIWIPMMA